MEKETRVGEEVFFDILSEELGDILTIAVGPKGAREVDMAELEKLRLL